MHASTVCLRVAGQAPFTHNVSVKKGMRHLGIRKDISQEHPQEHFLGAYVRHATACRDIVWTHTALHGPRWAMRLDVGKFILLQQLFSVMLECACNPADDVS